MEKPFWIPRLWALHLACLGSAFLMGLSAWLVWADGGFHRQPMAMLLYLSQLGLSLAWDPVVFKGRGHSKGQNLTLYTTKIGLVLCMALFGVLIACARAFKSVNPIAGDLVKPCLGWAVLLSLANLKLVYHKPVANSKRSLADSSMAYHNYISYSTLDSSEVQVAPIVDLRHNSNFYELEYASEVGNSEAKHVFDEMSPRIFTKAVECDSLDSTSSVPAVDILVGLDSIEIDPIDYTASATTTLSNKEDKVFDQISQGIGTVLWYHSADDVPFPISFDDSPLLLSSVEQLNAQVLFPGIESALEEDTTSYVNQVFVKSPKRDTTEQCSQFATMLMDSFICLVRGQDFKVDSCVPLSIESEVLTQEDFPKTKVFTCNMANLEDRHAEWSFLLLGFHCEIHLNEVIKNILWFHHNFNVHLDYWRDTVHERSPSGFLLFESRVRVREEKIQRMTQAITETYSTQSPNIWVNNVVKRLFAMFGLAHKARSTSSYIIFDPGGVNTSFCEASEQLLFKLVKGFTTETFYTTQQYMKTQPATAVLTAMLHEWKALEPRSGYKVKLQVVQGAGYTFSGVGENYEVPGHVITELHLILLKSFTANIKDQGCNWLIAGVMGLGGVRASKTVYQCFMDNSSIVGSEHVNEYCLYYISSAFKTPFGFRSVLDGFQYFQLSEAISYTVAYYVNSAFDREGIVSMVTKKDSFGAPFQQCKLT
ncbi:translocator protein-like protein [Nicotiana attenuata]|uniref:Translocator protein-like protein n=1 Tax=Nicotiana attenuata TaxID=49451 RepID=A0A314L1R5_NICAT|nr:translocator protein-like protein [Nicotiana attenuata]